MLNMKAFKKKEKKRGENHFKYKEEISIVFKKFKEVNNYLEC